MASATTQAQIMHQLGVLSEEHAWKVLHDGLKSTMSRSLDPNRHIRHIFTGLTEVTAADILTTQSPDTISTNSDETIAHYNRVDSSPGPSERGCERILSKRQRSELDDESSSTFESELERNSEEVVPCVDSASSRTSGDQTESRLLKRRKSRCIRSAIDFGEERFAKLDKTTRTQSQPNIRTILEKAWRLFSALHETKPEQPQIFEADSLVKQLCTQLRVEEREIANTEGKCLLTIMRMRYTATRLAEVYEPKRRVLEKVLDARPGRKKSEKRQRLSRDTALDDIVREWYSLPASCEIDAKDSSRATVGYWLEVGRPMLAMVSRLGEAAYVAPGLLLDQKDLKRVGVRQIEDFSDYIDKCYEGLKPQLYEISPIIKTLLVSGSLGPLRLNIQLVGSVEELSRVQNLSISHWINYSRFLDAFEHGHETDQSHHAVEDFDNILDQFEINTDQIAGGNSVDTTEENCMDMSQVLHDWGPTPTVPSPVIVEI